MVSTPRDELNGVVGAMTVLEEVTMASSSLGGDRYITPEYLAPLPQVRTKIIVGI